MKDKKPLIAVLVVGVICLIGGTLAYFTDSVDIANVFRTKPYSTEVTETFTSPDNWTPGTTTPKTVVVKNTGDVQVAVRVSYTEKWVSTDGTVLSGTQGTQRAAIINFANTTDWTKEGNYYYYKSKLNKNQSTSSFLQSVTFNSNITSDSQCTTVNNVTTCASTGKGYDGATYTLTIKVETVQADAYKTLWNTNLTIN